MALKKAIEGQSQPKDLWNEPTTAIPMDVFAKETAETEKVLSFGESNSGKTSSYLDILAYYKALGIPKEKVMMCIAYPDRATGITKLYNKIPKEYVDRVFIYPVNCYEDVIRSTADAERKLTEHFKASGMHGWLVTELMDEIWRMAQDYYSRMAFGETLADLLAAKRQQVKEMMEAKDKPDKDTAYLALSGWQDWTVIKFYHNFNWIDRIKKMPFNVWATAEIKEESNKDSIFYAIKIRPSGEKDNIHRFDTILYKSHKGDKFFMQCFKLTGYSRLYSEVDITDKNSYSVHKKILKQFEDKGYRSSAIEELELEAGIPSPPKPTPKVETPTTVKTEPIKEKVERKPVPPKEEKTIEVISGTPQKEETTKISKEEVTTPAKKKEVPKEDFDWSM